MNAPPRLALKPSARLFRRLFALVLCLFLLGLLTGYVSNFYAYRKARQLLNAVQALKAGKSTVEDVQKLLKHFGGIAYKASEPPDDFCRGNGWSYNITINSPVIVLQTIRALPALQKIGLHPWIVLVGIDQKNGKVTCYSTMIQLIRPDDHVIEGYAEVKERNPQSLLKEEPYQADSFVSRSYYHETRVVVLTEAPEEQKRRAFQMHLPCVLTMRGCDFPCQIIPLGWVDSVRDRQAHGRALPEGANDSRCPAY